MFKTILVPTDGSEYSKRAFTIALDLARACHSRIILLHVSFTPEALGYTLKAGNAVLQDEFNADGKQALQATLEGQNSDNIRLDVKQIPGHPAPTILDEATYGQIDLIIMGSHGYGPLAGPMLGSVSQKVLHRAQCPVLIVK